MKNNIDFLSLNKKAWDNKVPYHIASSFYGNDEFIKGKSSLKHVEIELLNRLQVSGKKVLHLQCQFGQDSISLARMGGEVTAVDFSKMAIEKARELAEECAVNVNFIEENVLTFNPSGDALFDVVFTSFGTIGWFPDLRSWAAVVSRSMKSGGTFVMVDFHPFVWTFDDEIKLLAYDYFQAEPIVEVTKGTYADRTAPLNDTIATWNHGMAEIITALVDAGLIVKEFKEYDYSPYDCFSNLREDEDERFRFAHLQVRIPMLYSLVLEKPSL
ncbi:MAG: methyltransferase domain-containing protein [Bacteroidetes bacterium]|nr:methyltransferase domain-containing protein [Bacteroidota bacterium]